MNEEILRNIAQHLMDAEIETSFEAGDYDADPPILVAPQGSVVQFKIQDGPIKEVGKNGCQVDDIIRFAKYLIEGFDEKFPCEQNDIAIGHLGQALHQLRKRRIDREERGVEGTNEA